jgi:hypothetical protein
VEVVKEGRSEATVHSHGISGGFFKQWTRWATMDEPDLNLQG